jgi:hypothetical protein
MFADQIITATAVITLSRPQIAILDFHDKSVYNLRGKKHNYGSLTHGVREGKRQLTQRTMKKQAYNGTRPAQDYACQYQMKGLLSGY